MRKPIQILTLTGALAGAAAAPASAATLNVTLEIPKLTVAEYHRPYVAVWIERPDQTAAGNLAVWYEVNSRNNEGLNYLKDLRQWWRRTGRDLTMPIDGVSGATRAPGPQVLAFSSATPALAKLPPGDYSVVVEAAREVGGREVVKIPFQWPPKKAQAGKAQGAAELGAVTLAVKP